MTRPIAALVACLLYLLAASPIRGQRAAPDPAAGEVPLPAAPGWEARLLLDRGSTGVWTVGAYPVFDAYGASEVVALDDEGRCTVLVSYSGKWTPLPRIHDGAWLGGLAHGDVDPRVEGAELYTGGRKGNLYQLVARAHGALDARWIAYLPGREIHTIVAGELDPVNAVPELLVFTRPGGLFRVTPTGEHGRFEVDFLGDLPGRVRDARILPSPPGEGARIATAGRDGALRSLRLTPEGPRWTELHREACGMGRLALAPGQGAVVLYLGLDDGRVLRLEEGVDGWSHETVYAGPQGLRGIAAGRFHADATRESIAVFGYSGKVQLLTRPPGGPWSVETIFEDTDRGHWLCAAEVDGRNGTDELLGSGYSGRVFQLGRPPGYGTAGVATDPDPARGAPASDGPLRVAVRGDVARMATLSPLSYRGGFQPKTMVFETLVRRDADGRLAPGLASSWEIDDGGRTYRFELREGARFHDGAPVDAESVCLHFRRWVGLPEHAWLGASERIREVRAESERVVCIELDEPYALLSDLCAVNPCAIEGPGARDAEGERVHPVGSGPLRLTGRTGADTFGFESHAAASPGSPDRVELLVLGREASLDPLDELLHGRLELVVDGWYANVARERWPALAGDSRVELFDVPGSSVRYLSFRLAGPTAERKLRLAVASAVDRSDLIARAEHGLADPATGWAAPTVRVWPARATPTAPHSRSPVLADDLRLLVDADDPGAVALAPVLAEQLGRAALPVEIVLARGADHAARSEEGAFDLRLERTWGVPYDPLISLRARFLPPAADPPAGGYRGWDVDPRLTGLVEAASRLPGQQDRSAVFARIQELLDEECWIVPLLVPRRLGAARASRITDLTLDHDLYRTALEGLAGER